MARLWHMRALRYLGLLLLLLSAYAGLHALAENTADSVSVIVRAFQDSFDSSRTVVVFTRTIDNAQTAQQAQATVNSTELISPLQDVSCEIGYINPPYRYHIEFRLHGLLIEVADVDTSSCEWWSISALGMPPLIKRLEPQHFAVLAELNALTGIPIPAGP